jgi:hypothetical protein
MGTSGECGISNQADSIERHPGDLNVDHRLDEGVLGRQDHSGQVIGKG